MKIDWCIVPHARQRYDSAGDWYWTTDAYGKPVLNIRVSQLSKPEWEFCLGLHECIEAMICYFRAVDQDVVDAFDMPLEAAHQRGDAVYPCGCARRAMSDPGSDKHCPYYLPHRIADAAERVVAFALGVNWEEYDREVATPPTNVVGNSA